MPVIAFDRDRSVKLLVGESGTLSPTIKPLVVKSLPLPLVSLPNAAVLELSLNSK